MFRIAPVGKDSAVVTVKITAQAKHSNKKIFILCLDNSGSMSGKPIEYAREGVAQLISQVVNEVDETHFITYNSAITHEVIKPNDDRAIARIKSTTTQGSTFFHNLFDLVSKICHERITAYNGKVEICCYIFTDGKHECGLVHPMYYRADYLDRKNQYDNLYNTELEKLVVEDNKKLALSKLLFRDTLKHPKLVAAGGRSCVKTRTFGLNPDTIMMDLLNSAGTEEGDFLHANDSKEILDIIGNDKNLSSNSLSGVLHFGSGATKNIVFDSIDNDLHPHVLGDDEKQPMNQYEAKTIISLEDFKTGRITLTLNDSDEEKIVLTTEFVGEECIDEIFDAKLYLYSTTLKEIASRLVQANGNKPLIDELVTALTSLDYNLSSSYDEMYSKLKSRTSRKSLGTQYHDMRKELQTIKSSALNLVRGAANSDLAKILHAGHQAKRRNLQNRLESMALKGIKKIEESEQKLEEIKVANAERKEEITKTLSASEIRCMISLSSPADAVLDQDIICLTGFMSRGESAIGSPYEINVQHIYSLDNCILFSIFRDELLGQLESGDYDKTNTTVSGGFDVSNRARNGNGVMNNAYRSMLNFAYPLYINADHWAIAKCYLEQICAWMPTLDFTAQTFDQIKAVPFVMVFSALIDLLRGNKPDQAKIQAFMSVARVARQVCIDYNLKHINEDFVRWQASYAGRVPAAIPNIMIFLTKLLFMNELPRLDDDFYVSVYEEISRRSAGKSDTPWVANNFIANQNNYLNYVTKPDVTNASEEKYAKVYDASISITANEYKAPTFAAEYVVQQTADTDLLLEKISNKLIGKFTLMNTIKRFYEFWRGVDYDRLFRLFDENLGVVTDEIVFAFQVLAKESSISNDAKEDDAKEDESKLSRTTDHICDELSTTHAQYLNMLVQNQRHVDNKFREEAKLLPVRQRDIVDDFKKEVEKSIQAEETRLLTIAQTGANVSLTNTFLNTEHIAVAAGIILTNCHNVGSPMFHMLLTGLQRLEYVPHREDKIRMIVDGTYDGKQLYRAGFVYPANKKNQKRLIFASNQQRTDRGQDKMLTEFWEKLFKYQTARI
jgi:hypothetical protein